MTNKTPLNIKAAGIALVDIVLIISLMTVFLLIIKGIDKSYERVNSEARSLLILKNSIQEFARKNPTMFELGGSSIEDSKNLFMDLYTYPIGSNHERSFLDETYVSVNGAKIRVSINNDIVSSALDPKEETEPYVKIEYLDFPKRDCSSFARKTVDNFSDMTINGQSVKHAGKHAFDKEAKHELSESIDQICLKKKPHEPINLSVTMNGSNIFGVVKK